MRRRGTLAAVAALILCAAAVWGADVRPAVTYDRFKDVTTIATPVLKLPVSKGKGKYLFTLWLQGHPGKKPDPATMNDTMLEVICLSRKGVFTEGRETSLILLLNDKDRVPLGPSRYRKNQVGDKVVEHFWFEVEDDAVASMVRARTVEGQLGDAEFVLAETHRKAVAAFAEAAGIVPPPDRPDPGRHEGDPALIGSDPLKR
jgi:hypothetical protein